MSRLTITNVSSRILPLWLKAGLRWTNYAPCEELCAVELLHYLYFDNVITLQTVRLWQLRKKACFCHPVFFYTRANISTKNKI